MASVVISRKNPSRFGEVKTHGVRCVSRWPSSRTRLRTWPAAGTRAQTFWLRPLRTSQSSGLGTKLASSSEEAPTASMTTAAPIAPLRPPSRKRISMSSPISAAKANCRQPLPDEENSSQCVSRPRASNRPRAYSAACFSAGVVEPRGPISTLRCLKCFMTVPGMLVLPFAQHSGGGVRRVAHFVGFLFLTSEHAENTLLSRRFSPWTPW
jgi:hypothetical protein